MPRPRRAHGRPGTAVIPPAWEADHAVVAAKTFTATVKIWPRATAPDIKDDLSYDDAGSPSPVYVGGARIQVLSGGRDAANQMIGDQAVSSVAYLVAIDREAAPIRRGYVVEVVTSNDATLQDGRRLAVERVDRGSLRFERDLYCTDQLEEATP